jgi:MFS family permease
MASTTQYKNVRLIKLGSFFTGLAFFRAMFSLYFLYKGVGLQHVVFSQALYSVLVTVSEIPTGVIGDKFGHRTSVLIGKLMLVVPYVMYIFMPTVFGLYLSFLFFGVGDSLVSGSEEAQLHGYSNNGQFKKNISSVMSNDIFGGVVGTTVASLTYALLGTKAFVLLLGLNAFTRFLSAITTYFTTSAGKQFRNTDSNMLGIMKVAMQHIKNSSTLRNLALVKVLTVSAQYVVYGLYAPYFQTAGVPKIFIGLVMTFGLVFNGFFMRYLHILDKYVSLDKIVLILPGIMGLTYAGFSFAHSPWLLIVLFILLQAQFDLLGPFISDYVNHETEDDIRATVISGMSMVSTLANVASKLMLGVLVAAGGIVAVFRFQAIYLLLGGIISYWLLRRCGCVYVLPKQVE